MIRNRLSDSICLLSIFLALLLAIGLMAGCFLYAPTDPDPPDALASFSTEYADLLFDDSRIHEIDLLMPKVNWDYMVKNALDEQYVLCDAVIDGERIENAAIRPKGNSSLKAIQTQGSDHFSFKLEFDHYSPSGTYHGLDKLALNNLGQDISCMKDYLAYHMMQTAGVPSPLSSYVHLRLNGEDFGLYLAVESIEDAFAYRNYGDTPGNLYKPEPFMIDKVTPSAFMNVKENPFDLDFTDCGPGDRADLIGNMMRIPFESAFGYDMKAAALRYDGDDPKRYRVITESAVFENTPETTASLIQAIQTLDTTTHPLDAVDTDTVIPYFAVHSFLNNYDGYSGIFVHNYYLREYEGRLSMIPWDYNLCCGIYTFKSMTRSILGENSPYLVKPETGEAMDDDTSMVNFPIDTPAFVVPLQDRPLLSAILTDPDTLRLYHETYSDFLDAFFASGRFEDLYENALTLLTPFIEKGQTFYTPEAFHRASQTVHDYFLLREESIRRQLSGALPSTMEGQRSDYTNLVDASALNLGDTATFDALIFGIRAEDILEILDAIAGEHEHSAAGIGAAVQEVSEDASRIPALLLRVASGSRLLKNTMASLILPPFLLLVSLLTLVIVRKRVLRYSRRRDPKNRKGGRNAVSS